MVLQDRVVVGSRVWWGRGQVVVVSENFTHTGHGQEQSLLKQQEPLRAWSLLNGMWKNNNRNNNMFKKLLLKSLLGLLLAPLTANATLLTINFSGNIYASSDPSWVGQTFTGAVEFDPADPGGTHTPTVQTDSNSISLHSVGATPNWTILGTPWLRTTLNLPGGTIFQTLSFFNSVENQTVSLITPDATQQLYISDTTSFKTYLNTWPYSIDQTHNFTLSAVYFPSIGIGTPFATGLDLASIDLADATGSGSISLYEINVGDIPFRHTTAQYRLVSLNGVPEPGTFALTGIGLAAAAIGLRRKQHG